MSYSRKDSTLTPWRKFLLSKGAGDKFISDNSKCILRTSSMGRYEILLNVFRNDPMQL
jgi:hypothetical protein